MDIQNDNSARRVEMVTLEFTEKQILGLLPAAAIIDITRAKEVLEKVAKAQAELTRDETLQEAKLRQLEANEFIRQETLRKVGEWLKSRCGKPDYYNGHYEAYLYGSHLDSLLRGEMPDEGSPATPPPSEAIKP